MSTENKFEGWVGLSPDAAEGNLVWQAYSPKTFEETDVDIEISHCGVCGSDIHTLRSGWGPTEYPVVVGHEIVGKAIRVGKDVKGIKEGDRVGVGAQSASCLKGDCNECSHDCENYCTVASTHTYNSKYPSGDKAYGGYAKYWRGNGHFVIPIPDEIPSAEAAPMLCGGVTTYSPLKQHGCGTTAKRVGIIGIGGLGHFGLLWARALGAEKVVAISRSRAKEEDAKKLGADYMISTGEEGWQNKNKNSLDLIISTIASPKLPLMDYLNLLDIGGTFCQVGAPEDPVPEFYAFALIMKRVKIAGSLIGSPAEIREMFDLAVSKKVKAWVNERPMAEANQAIVDFEKGLPRYRFVLKN